MRRGRGEVPRLALLYFLSKGEGHAYDFMREFNVGRYCTAQAAFKLLERHGLIYRSRMEKGEKSHLERSIYRLTFMGFAEALRIFSAPDVLQKAFSTHSDLCPAIFNMLAKSEDHELLATIASRIARATPRYFYDVTGLCDTLGFEEYRLAAPFVYCSLILDAAVSPPFWKAIEKIFGEDILKKFFKLAIPMTMLTLGTIESGFLFWRAKNKEKGDYAGESRSNEQNIKRSRKFVHYVSEEKAEVLFQKIQESWQEYYEAWRSWLMRFNPQTDNPKKLLKEVLRMKLEIIAEEEKCLEVLLKEIEDVN